MKAFKTLYELWAVYGPPNYDRVMHGAYNELENALLRAEGLIHSLDLENLYVTKTERMELKLFGKIQESGENL